MVKQMYYYIGDKNFSKGLSNYFNEFHWNNTEFEDFINKMVEAAGDKYNDLKELCDNWIKKQDLMKFLWMFKVIQIIIKFQNL